MQDLYNKYGHHPMFKRLKGVNIKDNPVFKKTTEFADDLRERYETSDHPVVHKVEVRVGAPGKELLSMNKRGNWCIDYLYLQSTTNICS